MKIVARRFYQMHKEQHMKMYETMCWTMEKSGSNPRQTKQILSFHKPEMSLYTRPAFNNTMGTGSTFLARKVDKACNFLRIYV